MANILLLETATEVCSVALASDDKIIAMKESTQSNAHSYMLSIFIDEVLKTAEMPFPLLNAVAVSSGPGSYTGLRIGVSSAKGICYALDIPLIAVDTLESLAYGAKIANFDFEGLYCPMIDARRMEVYSAFFDKNLQKIRPTTADIVNEEIYADLLQQSKVLFFGNGASKCKEVLSPFPNAYFAETKISATNMLSSALQSYQKKLFADVAYFEPFYLKDFVAVKSHVKGL